MRTVKRPVMIRIFTERQGLAVPFLSPFHPLDLPQRGADDEAEEDFAGEPAEDFDPEELVEEIGEMTGKEEPERTEMLMEGRLVLSAERAELVYEESELTGMEGTVTTVSFDRSQPELVSMLRDGVVNTALIFEPNKRHICLYKTPFSDFEICVRTIEVRNQLLEKGELFLDYLMEIHGASTERCKLTLRVN